MAVDPSQMRQRISGGLLHILKVSRVAWYRGEDGTTAYYEQPSPGVPGAVFVNGKRITSLVVDPEGIYADFPSPQVQHRLIDQGIALASGWTCGQEKHGTSLEEAMERSPYGAARHHEGKMSVQHQDAIDKVVIFVYGRQRWQVSANYAHHTIGEMGISTETGWYAVQTDLIAMHERGEQ